MSKEAIGMKKIDVVQAQQDIQFIYNCYKKFDLDVDECRAVLKNATAANIATVMVICSLRMPAP